MQMHNLRPHLNTTSVDTETSVSKRKQSQSVDNGENKRQKTSDNASFKKGNYYKGICDSESSNDYSHSMDGLLETTNSNVNMLSEEVTSEAIDTESSLSEELDNDGELYDVFNSERDTYSNVNANPDVSTIRQRQSKKIRDLHQGEINAVDDAVPNMVKDRFHKDVSWKTGLTSDEVKVLEPKLKRLRENIRNTVPTISKILKSGLTDHEMQRALQLYDVYKYEEPYSHDKMYLGMRISDMIRTAPKEVDSVVNTELERLLAKSLPLSVNQIVTARITESDKIRALQLYEAMQHCLQYSEEFFDFQQRVRSILDAQLPTVEDVMRVEEEETIMNRSMISFTSDFKHKIFELDADIDIKARIYEMYCEMMSYSPSDHKHTNLKEKITWAIKLPYRKAIVSPLVDKTPNSISTYCNDVYRQLDSSLYGMKEAKEKVIQCINDRIYNPSSQSVLSLKGKPGVGKTQLAEKIARAAGLPFARISLGGAIDSTIFKGSDGVWSGSAPSLLLQILSRVKYSNAVVLLDEIDKLGTTEKGIEVQHALLHVLDPAQNKELQDAFLNEFYHDISKIWFIPAMNSDSTLYPALKDRLDIIEVPTYTRDDMVEIIKLHILPDALADKGIALNHIRITDDAARNLLTKLGSEVDHAGMRPVGKAINNIVSKINLLRSMNGADCIPLTFKLKDFTGFPYTITSKSIDYLLPNVKTVHFPMHS